MFRDGTLENFNKFTFGNVLVKTLAQIFGDIVNELLARLMNRHGVWSQSELFVYIRVVCARSEIERPARLVDEPPAQCAIKQGKTHFCANVVDQSAYLRAVRKTDVNYFTVYSERPFPRFRPRRKNHVKVLQDFANRDIDICVNPADSNRPVHARQPTGRCDCELPGFALRDA